MSFLLDLIKTLTEDELKKLNSMPVKGREEEVLHKTLKYRKEKTDVDVDARIQKELSLTKSHYDKINSVLLRKCYEHFTDGSSEQVLNLIFEKRLMALQVHELKIREKNLLKNGTRQQLNDFYWAYLLKVRSQSVNGFDKKWIISMAHKYLATLPKATLEDEAEVMLMCESTFVFYHAVIGEGPGYEPVFLKLIADWEKKLKGKKYHRANFQLLLSKANYYDYYTSNHAIVDTLEEALREFDLAKEKIPVNQKMYAYSKLAKAYCQCSRFEEAMRTYKECFRLWGEEMRKNHYQMLMYSVVALINREFDEAQNMIEYMMPKLTSSTDIGMKFNTFRNNAILHMHKSEYDEALKHIHSFMQFPRSETDLLGDILNRMIHNVYFVMIGDFETATNLIEKNKKFLRSKGKTILTAEYTPYFNMLRDIIRYKTGIVKLPADFDKKMEPFQQGIMKLYGDLLLKMLQRG
ncbi:MAG: hypothetical protein JWO06_2765 [Bacteroidota bacterium]|nr:hypothetical protein [Bacteroidota bacterium]